jgi:hypothetical protein
MGPSTTQLQLQLIADVAMTFRVTRETRETV